MGKKQRKIATDNISEENSQEAEIKSELIREDDIKTEPEADVPEVKHNKQARLIVRNLSFKATENKVRKFFSPYGELTDIQILRRPDGRLVGCCFVEYALKTSAAKAIAHASGQPFLSRPVVVDWAVSKDKYVQKSGKSVTDDSEESGFHEDEDPNHISEEIKVEKEDSDDDTEGDEDDEDDGENDVGSSDEDGSDMDNGGEEDSESENEDNRRDLKPRKPLRESHDISEGCTIFVKNLPFSVDNHELKKCMQRFGPIYYALVCIDPLTEHSRGTGFVKFKSKEVAEACLTAGGKGEIIIGNTVIETHPAVNREDLQKGPKKSEFKKDGRNLYLVKEGVILAGSSAASGISQADMAKRLQIEQWKTQVLRNLNKFVSRNRLMIQNLPSTYDDQKLRALCLRYGGTNPVITEARVMRDLRNVDVNGKGKSKEFGFVTFTQHENALYALRALNNNPDVFTPAKRPIVAFSIEDKKALNIRHKRLEKSRANLSQGQNKGPSQKEWEQKRRDEKIQGKNSQGMKKQNDVGADSAADFKSHNQATLDTDRRKLSKKEKRQLKRKKLQENQQNGSETPTVEDAKSVKYMGEKAQQGQAGIMSRQKLREQAELHNKTLKAKSRKDRMKKQRAAIKIKQPKQKMAKPKDLRKEDNFSKLVNKYKNQLASSETERKKWYDQ